MKLIVSLFLLLSVKTWACPTINDQFECKSQQNQAANHSSFQTSVDNGVYTYKIIVDGEGSSPYAYTADGIEYRSSSSQDGFTTEFINKTTCSDQLVVHELAMKMTDDSDGSVFTSAQGVFTFGFNQSGILEMSYKDGDDSDASSFVCTPVNSR